MIFYKYVVILNILIILKNKKDFFFLFSLKLGDMVKIIIVD